MRTSISRQETGHGRPYAYPHLAEKGDVTVFVYDRETGDIRPCERRDVEEEDSRAIAPATAAIAEQSTAALEAQRTRGWQRCGHIRQHLRPVIVELIARRARELEPNVAALSLFTRSGDDDNAPVLNVHAGLDAAGDVIATETLTSDRRLQQLLFDLTDIDGPYVDSIDVASTRDAQADR